MMIVDGVVELDGDVFGDVAVAGTGWSGEECNGVVVGTVDGP
jgi:hypothetical protein